MNTICQNEYEKLLSKLRNEFLTAKAADDKLLQTKVRDLTDPITGRKFGDLITLQVSKNGHLQIVVGSGEKTIVSRMGDYGFSAVNAVAYWLTIRFSELHVGVHQKLFDRSSMSESNVAYVRQSSGWQSYDWYAGQLRQRAFDGPEHEERANGVHSELDVIVDCLKNGWQWCATFAGSNEDRAKRHIEELLDMTLADARERMKDDFKIAATIDAANKKGTTAKLTGKPVLINGVDLRTIPMPFMVSIEVNGFRFPREIKGESDLAFIEANIEDESVKFSLE